jgi:hypothetical protein
MSRPRKKPKADGKKLHIPGRIKNHLLANAILDSRWDTLIRRR